MWHAEACPTRCQWLSGGGGDGGGVRLRALWLTNFHGRQSGGGSILGGDELAHKISTGRGALGGDAVHGGVDDAKVGVGEAIGDLLAHRCGEDIILIAPDE